MLSELLPFVTTRAAGAALYATSLISEHDISTWTYTQYFFFAIFIICSLELLSVVVMVGGDAFTFTSKPLPEQGPHLNSLSGKDITFIIFNKATTILFSYHLLDFYWNSSPEYFPLTLDSITASNTIVALPFLFICYEFFYTPFHRFLHHRYIYKHIHKHHHRQKAPSRGNNDAVNVHPIEFVIGEWNHLLSIKIVSTVMQVHILTVLNFILLGGVMASLNHTRYDVNLQPIFSVRIHDLHHYAFNYNYCQYISLFDRAYGWYAETPKTKETIKED